MMQVLRSPYGKDLSWLYLVFSVFLWLWTSDFTHGVLKGEEICNRCVHKEESHPTDMVPGNLNWITGSPCLLHDVMMIPLPKYMAVNLEFID